MLCSVVKDLCKAHCLKGQSHEIFDLRFFFVKLVPLGPLIHGQIDSNSRIYSIKFDDKNRLPSMRHSA
jgi:hypothetical protein